MIDIKAEIEKIATQHDYDFNVYAVNDVIDICTRINAAAREEAAQVCEQIGSELSPVGFGRKVVNECAAAIRATKGRGRGEQWLRKRGLACILWLATLLLGSY